MRAIFPCVHLRFDRSAATDFLNRTFSMAKPDMTRKRKATIVLPQDATAAKPGETIVPAAATPRHVGFSYITK
jgi:hypothetical protein